MRRGGEPLPPPEAVLPPAAVESALPTESPNTQPISEPAAPSTAPGPAQTAEPEELEFLGFHEEYRENIFYGKPFRNREISAVYVYRELVKAEELSLQREEVESVRWMDFSECLEAVKSGTMPTCLHEEELKELGQYLGVNPDQGSSL